MTPKQRIALCASALLAAKIISKPIDMVDDDTIEAAISLAKRVMDKVNADEKKGKR